MSENSPQSSPQSLSDRAPMSVSDILKTGWRLYVSNYFSQYWMIALIATAWSLLPTVFNLLTTFIPTYLGKPLSPGISVLLFVVWIAIALYCIAQSLGQFAGISRLSYQSLSNGTSLSSKSETPAESLPEAALQFTRARKFSFLGATILQSLVLFFTSLALAIVTAVFFAVVGGIAGAIAGEAGINPIVGILVLLLFLGWLIAAICVYLYVFTRFMLFEQPLAIEQDTDVFGALARAWELTQHSVLRSMLVAFLLNLLTLTIIMIPLGIMNALIPTDWVAIFSEEEPDPELIMQALLPFSIAMIVISTAISIGLVPLFKTTFTTLYFDLRDRFERRAFRESVVSERVE